MKKILSILAICAVLMVAVPAHAWMFGGAAGSEAASETVAGTTKRCTDAEMVAGTSTACAGTPANLRAVISDDIADATLSGTPVIFTIKDKDGNAYYIKAYPTKTP